MNETNCFVICFVDDEHRLEWDYRCVVIEMMMNHYDDDENDADVDDGSYV